MFANGRELQRLATNIKCYTCVMPIGLSAYSSLCMLQRQFKITYLASITHIISAIPSLILEALTSSWINKYWVGTSVWTYSISPHMDRLRARGLHITANIS